MNDSKIKTSKTLIHKEVTPLTDESCLYVIARKKDGFDFPIHAHNVFELNYIEGGGWIHLYSWRFRAGDWRLRTGTYYRRESSPRLVQWKCQS